MVVRVTYPIECQIYVAQCWSNNFCWLSAVWGHDLIPCHTEFGKRETLSTECLLREILVLWKWWRYHALSKRSWYLWHHDMETNPALLALCDRWLPIIKDHKCGALLFELVFVWTRRRLNKQSMFLWFEHSWVVTVICVQISFQTLYPTSPMYRASSHQKE